MKSIVLHHIVGLTMGIVFVIIGAICLGYAARGWTYAVAGLVGLIFASGGIRVVRMVLRDIDHFRDMMTKGGRGE